MKKILLLFLLMMVVSFNVYTQPTREYEKAVKEMLKVSGSQKIYETSIIQMLDMFKQMAEEVPEEAWKILEEELLDTSLDELTELLIPVYYRHLTLTDLETMISFYNTPVGKKFVEKSPLIMQESMEAGQKWGEQLGKNVEKKIRELGY